MDDTFATSDTASPAEVRLGVGSVDCDVAIVRLLDDAALARLLRHLAAQEEDVERRWVAVRPRPGAASEAD